MLEVSVGSRDQQLCGRLFTPTQHTPLAPPRTQGLERHMPGYRRGPRRKPRGPDEAALAERDDDLLEGGLHEVIVVHLAAAENAVERAIDHADQPIVELSGHLRVTARGRVDQLLVAFHRVLDLRRAFGWGRHGAQVRLPGCSRRNGHDFKHTLMPSRPGTIQFYFPATSYKVGAGAFMARGRRQRRLAATNCRRRAAC
jgi:hypothetical protein